MTLGESIYKHRKRSGMSQDGLAERLGVSRQSVSKWETDTAVPEVERLVAMSEIFGVTLDELVRGDKAAPPDRASADTERRGEVTLTEPAFPIRKIAGTILFCFAFLTFLVITILGGVLSGVVFASPFALCGAVCFIFKKRIGLWCCWSVFFAVDLYFSMATALNRANILHTFSWTYSMNYMILALSWVSFLVMLSLMIWTAISLRKSEIGKRKSAITAGISLAAIAVSKLLGYLLSRWHYSVITTPDLEYSKIRGASRIFSWCAFGLSWVEIVAFTVLFAILARAIFRSRHKNT